MKAMRKKKPQPNLATRESAGPCQSSALWWPISQEIHPPATHRVEPVRTVISPNFQFKFPANFLFLECMR